MTYEVQLQLGSVSYTVRGPEIDGVITLVERLQAVGKPSPAPAGEGTFVVSMPATPLPKIDEPASDWVTFRGISSPVPKDTKVEVRMGSDQEYGPHAAHTLDWGTVSAYRVVHP